MLRITIGAIMLLLVCCGVLKIIETNQARNHMLKSKQVYLDCLKQHAENISACDSLKAAYEADVDAYQVLKWGRTQNTIKNNQRSQ
jgi:hypothetical protein